MIKDQKSPLKAALDLLDVCPKGDCEAVKWIDAAYPMVHYCEGSENVVEAALRIIASSREWYADRLNLLQHVQKHMRYPERNLVCAILANGQLLPDPTGKMYGFPTTGFEHINLKQEGKNNVKSS